LSVYLVVVVSVSTVGTVVKQLSGKTPVRRPCISLNTRWKKQV